MRQTITTVQTFMCMVSTHLIHTNFNGDDVAGHLLGGSVVLLAEGHDVDTLRHQSPGDASD